MEPRVGDIWRYGDNISYRLVDAVDSGHKQYDPQANFYGIPINSAYQANSYGAPIDIEGEPVALTLEHNIYKNDGGWIKIHSAIQSHCAECNAE